MTSTDLEWHSPSGNWAMGWRSEEQFSTPERGKSFNTSAM